MKQILLLEDDIIIASGLVYALSNEGYEVMHCEDVGSAFSSIKNKVFDLAILDMQLPDGTGFNVSTQLRKTNTPIVFLTVVDDETNIVHAFENGAEDYVVKPFRIRELLARIKRTLHKQDGNSHEMLTVGQVSIDVNAGKVYVKQVQVELTALEYRLLLIFAKNKSKLLTRTQILDKIWDVDGNFVEDNTLTVYVKRLREKLGTAIIIETVRGIGYRVD